jgi:hypothetical protein
MKSKVSIIILNWNSWQETLLQAKAFKKLLRKVLSKTLRRKTLRNDRVPGIVVDG